MKNKTTFENHIKFINDNIEEFDNAVKSSKQETNEWRLTNGEAYIMEGSKEVAKVLYPINSEEDFEKFNDITKLLLNAPKMKNLLKDILNHIDLNLISLESSNYLKDDILKLIEDAK